MEKINLEGLDQVVYKEVNEEVNTEKQDIVVSTYFFTNLVQIVDFCKLNC